MRSLLADYGFEEENEEVTLKVIKRVFGDNGYILSKPSEEQTKEFIDTILMYEEEIKELRYLKEHNPEFFI